MSLKTDTFCYVRLYSALQEVSIKNMTLVSCIMELTSFLFNFAVFTKRAKSIWNDSHILSLTYSCKYRICQKHKFLITLNKTVVSVKLLNC